LAPYNGRLREARTHNENIDAQVVRAEGVFDVTYEITGGMVSAWICGVGAVSNSPRYALIQHEHLYIRHLMRHSARQIQVIDVIAARRRTPVSARRRARSATMAHVVPLATPVSRVHATTTRGWRARGTVIVTVTETPFPVPGRHGVVVRRISTISCRAGASSCIVGRARATSGRCRLLVCLLRVALGLGNFKVCCGQRQPYWWANATTHASFYHALPGPVQCPVPYDTTPSRGIERNRKLALWISERACRVGRSDGRCRAL
jgi:hypothetical protein